MQHYTFSGFPLLTSWPALVYNSSTRLQLNTGTNVFPTPLLPSDIIHSFFSGKVESEN